MEKLVRESGRTGRKEGEINNKDYLKKGGAVQKMRKLANQEGTQWSGEGNEKIWIELDEEGG